MKKLLLMIVLTGYVNFAQNKLESTGNVGIGTLNPQTKLDVLGQARFRVQDDGAGVGAVSISTNSGTDLRMGGNFNYSWIQSHMSLPLYINELGNNTIFNLSGGLVGIGTSSPAVRLDVSSWDVAAWFRSTANSVPVSIINTGTSISTIGFKGASSFNEFNVRLGADGNDLVFFTNNIERTKISSNGNFGIGTNNPLSKLEVYNSAEAGHLILSANDNQNADKTRIDIDFRVSDNNHTVGRISSAYINSAYGGSGGLRFFTRENGVLNEKMNINSNGNVGIGVLNPTNKLDVNGNIHSKEVKVDLNFPAPDYVFANDYKLRSLQEVENYIKENSHLPEIPSVKEFEKNGINVSEMNMALLKKIEELTLYVIEQNKTILELKQESKKLKDLEKRFQKLEKTLKK